VRPHHARLQRALLGVWAVAVGVVTLMPTGGPARTLSACLVCGEFGTSELLLNVLLFVPLGWLLASEWRARTADDAAAAVAAVAAVSAAGEAEAVAAAVPRSALLRAIAIGATLSLSIELLQWLAIPGRVTSLGDWIANTLGAALGAWLLVQRHSASTPHMPLLRRTASLLGIAAMLAYGWWSSTPWLPDGRWFLQRTPVRTWSDAHSGAVTFAGIDATNLPSDRIGDPALVRAVREGAGAVVVEERVGPRVPRLAYAVRVVEANGGHELLALARDGNDALLTRLTQAARARTGRVGLRVRDAYARSVGATVRWSMQPVTGRVKTEPNVAGAQFVAPSVLRGWTLLLPRVVWLEGWQVGVADAVWLVVMVGLGGIRARKPRGIRARKPTG